MKNSLIIKKPNYTITISNGKISATQRKAYNVLLYSALQDLRADNSKSDFYISIAEIEEKAGIQETNNRRLKEDLEDLMTVKVECVRETGDWDIFVLLSRIKKEGNLLKFELPSPIRDALIRNDYYTALDLMIIKTFKCKYAIILYEIALRYNKVEIPKYTIAEFKKMTGTENYKNFNNLKKYCIKPAIEEINEKSDIDINYETFNVGRKVTEIKFRIRFKSRTDFDNNPVEKNIIENIQPSLEIELISLKFSKKQARAMVKKYPENQIRRNIDMTVKKAEDGEVRKIPAFLTEAVKEDYAKDYRPVDEKHQKILDEAKKCWKKTKDKCVTAWSTYKDEKTHVCHWCKRFDEQRKIPHKADPPDLPGNAASFTKPADEKPQALVSEAEICWEKNKYSCPAVWDNYRNDSTRACHWCITFAEKRGEKKPAENNDEPLCDRPESLLDFIPVKVTKSVRGLVEKYHRSHGAAHVRQSIEHTNRNIADKRKYRALLEKSLAEKRAVPIPESASKTGSGENSGSGTGKNTPVPREKESSSARLGDEVEKIIGKSRAAKKKPARKPAKPKESQFEKVRNFVEVMEADGMTSEQIERMMPPGYRKDFEKLHAEAEKNAG